MGIQKPFLFSESFNKFANELVSSYSVTRDEVLRAAAIFGDFRNKIVTYFIVQAYLKKRGLPLEDIRYSVVNRWFPS